MNVGIYFSESCPDAGGSYTFEKEILLSLLSIADESNHNFVIFSKADEEKNVISSYPKNIRIETIPKTPIIESFLQFSLKNFFPMSPLLRKIYTNISHLEGLMKRHKIDILLFCNPIHEPVGIPYITIVWDLQHRLQPWFPEMNEEGGWYIRETGYTQILQRSTYIITGGEAGRDEISFFYGIPKSRIRILPHPTPSFVFNCKRNNISASVVKKYGISQNYLLYPAQFWAHKNHANILFALKMLKESERLPLSIVFVGSEKNNLSYIERLADDLHLSADVFFLGFVDRNDLVDLYYHAFALLYPSFFGPENLPPLEAFALGCPVLASRVHGAEEQLGDAALLFDPRNPEDITNAIIKLYQNPGLREQLIEKGYARALRWTGKEFMRGIFSMINEFENIKRCWE
jgi:glycosyltransferase involved in cell wall biosynthesis